MPAPAAALNWPALQSAHCLLPDVSAKRPAAHSTQPACPEDAWYWPERHLVHASALAAPAYCPALQLLQLPSPSRKVPATHAGVGAGVGDAVGTEVGDGVGLGVGNDIGGGVGDGDGARVGPGVGDGVGLGVGDGVGASVSTHATCPPSGWYFPAGHAAHRSDQPPGAALN
jgi:hypothetical protein